MYYPDELVEEVRSRNDIVDIISSYVRLNKRGSNYFGLCPFHNEKTGSFSVTPAKQMFYCFGCHEGGNVITFLEKYENYTFQEALKVLADRAGIELPENMTDEDRVKENRRAKLLEINKEAGKYYYVRLRSESGQKGMQYLRGRRLSDETMQKFGLGYARSSTDETYRYLKSKGYSDDLLNASGLFIYKEKGVTDKFWNRVIFPIMDVNHRIIAFGGRVMGDGEPKYLNSPETELFNKRRVLYGLNHAKSSKAKNIIICEGYMDCISLHQAGFDQAVATLGTAMTSNHAALLERYAREGMKTQGEVTRYKDILLCFDSDGAGRDAAKRGIKVLRDIGLTPKVINMTPYKDPDEFIKGEGAEEFQKRIDSAENGFMFEIRMLEEDYDLKDPTGKSKFLNDVALRVLAFEDAIERESYIDKVAEKYKTSVAGLAELVKKHAMKGAGVVKTELAKPTRTAKATSEDAMLVTQGLLLNWISEIPEVYPIVRKYISPDDFSDELCKKVAQILFEQIESGNPDTGKISAMFTEEEEQSQVARIFHQRIENIETLAEREAAIKDLIIRVKEYSLMNGSKDDTNVEINALQQMIEQKKQLDQLHRINIDLSQIGN